MMLKLIDANDLIKSLHISDRCETCPRYNENKLGTNKCKGHLQWMCMKIQKARVIAAMDNHVEVRNEQ